MTKDKFLKTLDTGNENLQTRLKCINYFMSNYPVYSKTGAQQLTIQGVISVKEWTSLKLLNIDITSEHRPDLINSAFKSLVNRKQELKNFK
jgi:hypothetical protein